MTTPTLNPVTLSPETLSPETLPPAGEGVQAAAAAPEAHGGPALPQFETQHYFGQVAYLLILFFILLLLIAKVFAPRLRRVIDLRAETISNAVAAARQVQLEAAEQAAVAKAEVEKARQDARGLAAAAKARVAAEAQARQAEDEARIGARLAEAEAAIGQTRDAAMAHVAGIAEDTARAMVERLTGQAPTAAELAAANGGAA